MRVKVCGLTNHDDAILAAGLGAWALGFVLYEKSPRYVAPDVVGKITRRLPATVHKVGVVVNASFEELQAVIENSGVDTIQLQGDERSRDCKAIKAKYPSLRIIKAFCLRDPEELSLLAEFKMCDALLIDAFVEGKKGGTGRLANLDLATKAKQLGNVVLAGGLNEQNVGAAISQVNPYAVDVSSSLESAPGLKSHEKMRRFFEAV